MDASMQQKVALTAAHLLCMGKMADMGMGSGTGSFSLAALYPGLSVVGVDVSEEMVAIARQRYTLPNLSFVVGDIATPVFEPGTLDGILDSSVLHHVTTFTDYDHQAAAAALAVQAKALKPGGVLIVRDFLAPATAQDATWLDVPTDDGQDDGQDSGGQPTTCSTAALLERFALEFRPLSAAPGLPLARVAEGEGPPLAAGRRRYRLTRRVAVEFILRKDYRRDWDTEIKEEYTYFDQDQFERQFATLGLRTLASTPIRNPWILANRYVDKFSWWSTEGAALELPATNYVIVGERVGPGQGVAWRHHPCEPIGFLKLEHFRHRQSGAVRDLVRRPHLTVDAVPWFEQDDDIRVLARMSYPRPLLTLGDGDSLDGSRAPGWLTEPLTVIADDKPFAQTLEDALVQRVGIPAESIRRFEPGVTYYPSPGGIQEEVRSMFVEIEPIFTRVELPNSSGFSTSGRVGAIEARQLLRAAQVGGLPDARLEMGVYELLRRRRRSVGPWIGAAINATACTSALPLADPCELAQRPHRRVFARVDQGAGFLQLKSVTIEELDGESRRLNQRQLEYVVPGPLSTRTASVALLAVVNGRALIGVVDDDLPAAQCIGGHSEILVLPAWRLPRSITSTTPARAWLAQRLTSQYGLQLGQVWELGGRYHPSPGSTPEVVHPMAWEVVAGTDAADGLHWIAIEELLPHAALLVDGHLRIAVYRLAHALGLLDNGA
ncbi:MAG: class I SAM-dependent methyltransferase [Nannocystaceae bacterium]|nr:class I SAM-dependent methyltransferase [Nannocystaceae bacterium]